MRTHADGGEVMGASSIVTADAEPASDVAGDVEGSMGQAEVR